MNSNKKNDIELLHEVEEGPYYKTESPQRNSIAAEDTFGKNLVFEGRVLDPEGKPIAGAWARAILKKSRTGSTEVVH